MQEGSKTFSLHVLFTLVSFGGFDTFQSMDLTCWPQLVRDINDETCVTGIRLE